MQLREVMTTDVELITPDVSLKEAAAMMRDGDFGLLPIGENDRLVGTVSDRDITIRAVAAGKDPNTTSVREAMSQGVIYCFEDQSVEEAAALMGEKQIRRLPILNRDKRLVGVVAIGDLATDAKTEALGEEALSDISKH
jgi:CBS domain-containing protein